MTSSDAPGAPASPSVAAPSFSFQRPKTWSSFEERIEFYLEAQRITDAKQRRAVLVSSLCDQTYDLLRALARPNTVNSLTYSQLVDLLRNHFDPKPNEILRRYHFYSRVQKEGESVNDFVADLRRLSADCNFAELDDMLRDRLVCGVRDEVLQRRLFAEKSLDFATALSLAQAFESAQNDVSAIRSSSQVHVEVERLHIDSQPRTVQKQPNAQNVRSRCSRCGDSRHQKNECPFRKARCRFCRRIGHLQRVCFDKRSNSHVESANRRDRRQSDELQTHAIHEGGDTSKPEESMPDYVASLYSVSSLLPGCPPPRTVSVRVDDIPLSMEIDSGASRSVISERTYREVLFGRPQLKKVSLIIRTWSEATIALLGVAEVCVTYNGYKQSLPLLVAQGTGPSLLGRDWFEPLGISVVCRLESQPSLSFGDTVKAEVPEVFEDGLGTFTGPPVSLVMLPDAVPKFLRQRPVAFALQAKVAEEIERLVQERVWEPVSDSKWATPIVPVLKRDGTIRLCADYRATVNPAVASDVFPLLTLDEALATLSGGKYFTRLDLKNAYMQIPVDEAAAEILTVNTQCGLFRVKRLPFGLKAAPGIFQRLMMSLVKGLDGVIVLLDDVLVMGSTEEEHRCRVLSLLHRLKNAGLRLKREKCVFAARELQFLGHVVSANGIHPTDEKVVAIRNVPVPQNKGELQAFLGLLNFYDRFLPKRADLLEPLYYLLKQHVRWNWNKEADDAFQKAKLLLSSSSCLTLYDGKRPLVVTCDASSVGVGAVMSHVNDDGVEQPIYFASRTLHQSERNYAQIDREALAIIFAVQKFRRYLLGRKFTIFTDHRPLVGLLSHGKPIRDCVSPRMLRWSLLLSNFDYELCYRPGKQMGGADALSRLPMPHNKNEIEPQPPEVFLLEVEPHGPLSATRIAQATRNDRTLSQVRSWIVSGWPENGLSKEFCTFAHKRQALSVQKDCVLFGSRVVVPASLRQEVLKMLHASHQGIVATKAIARSYVWWPGINGDIENIVGNCPRCLVVRHDPPKVVPAPWPVVDSSPWNRLHIDFAGPVMGKYLFVAVDSGSKWPEAKVVPTITSSAAIRCLREIFATHGLPRVLVSDNGPAFRSAEFQAFVKRTGLCHLFTAPFHPSSNGQAERTVQTVKQLLQKLASKNSDLESTLVDALFVMRTTPCGEVGLTPAQLLMKRKLVTALDRMLPRFNPPDAPVSAPSSVNLRSFRVGDAVMVKNFGVAGPKWLRGTVVGTEGRYVYTVQLANDGVVRRHIDQLLKAPERSVPSDDVCATALDLGSPAMHGPVGVQPHEVTPSAPRRSAREKRPPRYLQDYVLRSGVGGKVM